MLKLMEDRVNSQIWNIAEIWTLNFQLEYLLQF